MNNFKPYFIINRTSFVLICISWIVVGTFLGISIYGILDPILIKHSVYHETSMSNLTIPHALWTTNTCGYKGRWIHIDITKVGESWTAEQLCRHEVAHNLYYLNHEKDYNTTIADEFAYRCMNKDLEDCE